MKSPLPLLALGAAFFLMKGKSGTAKPKENLLVIKADSAIPLLKGPYIQVTSTWPEVGSDKLAELVRPISKANPNIKFVVAGPEGVDRLRISNEQGEFNTPNEFMVRALHQHGETPVIQRITEADAVSFEDAFTKLQQEVDAAVAYIKAPYTPGT